MMMNREIEFRAWDKVLNKFITDECKIYLNGCVSIEGFGWATEQVVLEQYTGLKDKNGKKIFEGDILKTEVHKGFISNLKHEDEYVGNVVFEDGSFFIGINENFGYGMEFHTKDLLYERIIFVGSDVEIIGNIHQNKELLDD